MPEGIAITATSPTFYSAENTAKRACGSAFSPPKGCHVAAGRMVLNDSAEAGYRAVLTYKDGATTAHPFQTMQEGEAFIRSEVPMPPLPAKRQEPELGRDESRTRPEALKR